MKPLSFVEELNQPTIHLPRAALTLARSIAYPTLNCDLYLQRLDELAAEAYPTVQAGRTLMDRADALSDFLFAVQNFRGNTSDYYDPRNSYLNEVLDRRMGIPITLSLVWIALAQRVGLRAYGVGLPGHFLVGLFDAHESPAQVFIDPFHAGLRRTLTDCDRLVRENTGHTGPFQSKWLNPIAPTDLLARMLTNLSQAYIRREDWQSAVPVLQHLLLAQPDSEGHLRDLGLVHLYAGSLRLSAQYLEEYLRRAPGAPDFEPVKTSFQIVTGRLALWN